MSVSSDLDKLTVDEFACRLKGSTIPLGNTFSYVAAMPLSEDDVKDYLEEPIAALPTDIKSNLPKLLIGLVPYLEKPNGKEKEKTRVAAELVTFEQPAENRRSLAARVIAEGETSLFFAVKERQVADYHYDFYRAIAALIAERSSKEQRSDYYGILREELSNRVHGEVDQESWHLKQSLMRRQTNLRRETKAFLEYAHQSFVDTLTLYLHGICCDIDVDTGPRQLPSRCLRKRLQLLESLYPPPEGYAVFPEELNAP